MQNKTSPKAGHHFLLPICGVALLLLIGVGTATFLYRESIRQSADRVAVKNPVVTITGQSQPNTDSNSANVAETKTNESLASANAAGDKSDAKHADEALAVAPKSAPGEKEPATSETEPAKQELEKENQEPKKDLSPPNTPSPPAALVTKATPKAGAEKKSTKGMSDENPFRNFPKAVQLPSLTEKNERHPDATKPVDFGKLQIDPKAICVIHLLGGESALKGKQKFLFDAADGGTAERDWDVLFDDGKSNTPDVKVAHVALRDQKLTFQWTDEAVKLPMVANLCNCVLQISAGKGTHVMALRKSVAGEGVAIGFVGEVVMKWDLPNPPNSEQIQVELRLPRDFGKYRFIGSSTLRGPSETTWIDFLGKRESTGLRLKIDAEMKRQVSLSLAPYFLPTPDSKPLRLTASTLKKQRDNAKNAEKVLEANLNMMPSMPPKGGGGGRPPPRGAPPNPRGPLEQQLRMARQSLEQIEEITELKDRLEGKGELQVRVFMDVEGVPVDLLTTAGSKRIGKK